VSKAPFYDDVKSLVALSGKAILDEAGQPTGEFAKAEAVLFNPIFNVRAQVSNWIKTVQNLFSSELGQRPLATFTLNRRSHDKILLIDAHTDNSMAILGGRNIADSYYSVGSSKNSNVLDAEVLIKGFSQKNEDGTIQNSLENHFNKIYYYMANKKFEDFLFKTNRNQARHEFQDMRASARHLFDENGELGEQLKQMEEGNFLETDFEDGLISILNEIQNLSRTKIFLQPNGPHNKKNGNSLVKKLLEQIAQADKTVDIVTPYFWASKEEIDFIVEWATADPKRKIRFFSNSVGTTDNVIAQAIVDTTFEDLILKRIRGTPLEKQFEIYTYGKLDDELLGGTKKYGFLHAKLVITDRKNVTISTSNLDPVSRHLNSEVGATIENLPKNSKNLEKLNNYISEIQKDSTLFGSDDWHKIKNHPNNLIWTILQAFAKKIIYSLNLVPLI
jgi:putative cardiolipin synthase